MMAQSRANPVHAWTDEDVIRHWDSVASVYVDANSAVSDAHDQRFLWAMPELNLVSGCRVLNISSRDCGAHPYLIKACSSARVTHAEISGGLIAVARGIHSDAQICKIERYDKLPFDSDSFDRVLTLETLEHAASRFGFL